MWWNPFAPPLLSDGRSPLALAVPDGYHLLLADDGRALGLQTDDTGVTISPAALKFGPMTEIGGAAGDSAPAPRAAPRWVEQAPARA